MMFLKCENTSENTSGPTTALQEILKNYYSSFFPPVLSSIFFLVQIQPEKEREEADVKCMCVWREGEKRCVYSFWRFKQAPYNHP